MKIKVLFFLIPGLLVVGALNASEIYNKDGNILNFSGRINSLHYFSKSNYVAGDKNYVSIGIKGNTQIDNNIIGYGQWQYQILDNKSGIEKKSFSSLAFAGLKIKNVGSFDYGKNCNIIYDIASWTNTLPEFNSNIYIANSLTSQNDNNFATYRNNNFFGLINGLNLSIQYQTKDSDTNIESNSNSRGMIFSQSGDGIGGSLVYDLGEGFTLGHAIYNSKNFRSQNETFFYDKNHSKTYSSGLKYDANNIYLATQYTQTNNPNYTENMKQINKTKNFGIVAQYQFDCGFRPSVAYLQSLGKYFKCKYNRQDFLKYVDISAIYSFNKNISTYVDYKINLLNEDNFTHYTGASTDNIIAMGLFYQF